MTMLEFFTVCRDSLKTLAKLVVGRGVRVSYSQFGEDAVIQAIFAKHSSGVYLDIGAYHPVLYSNTYALYKHGWHGIAVDPNRRIGNLYRVIRSRDTFVEAAVGADSAGEYYMFTDGAYNTFDPAVAEERKKLSWLKLTSSYSVQFKTMTEIVMECGITQIDFLNIDVEGKDFEVLNTYDWKVVPRVIAIEDATFTVDQPQASKIYNFLKNKNYKLEAVCGITLIWTLV